MAERVLRIAGGLALPLDAVTQTFGILARKGAGKTYTAAVFAEELIGAGLPVVILDPLGAFWGLRSSDDGEKAGLPVTILGGEHGDVPLDPHAGKVIADLVVEQPGAYILDLSAFESNAAQDRFVTDFAERLYRLKAADRAPLHLIVDEADSFAPQRPMPGQQRMLGAFEAIVRRGRIRGLGVTLITQRPAALNKNVLTQVECLIVLQVTGPQDRKAIDEWVAGNGTKEQRDELVASLASLPRGRAWFWSPSWLDVFVQAQVRLRHTFDSSKTPEPGEIIEPKRMAPVDIERLRERMAAAIAKAEADDPKKLRVQIHALEEQLAQRPKEHVVETVVERVEVPVLNGQVEELERVVDRFMHVGKSLSQTAVVLGQIGGDLVTVGASITAAIDRVTAAPAPAKVRERPVQMAIPPAPTPIRPTTPAEYRVPTSTLRPTERAILSVLAQWPEGRTQKQVATLTGYSPKSGGFFGALSTLRKLDAIEGSVAGLRITEAGRGIIGDDYDPLPTGDALREHWYAKLPKAEATILRALVEAFPASLSQEELAERTGYSGTSGGFFGALAKLRTIELISGGKPALRANEDLF